MRKWREEGTNVRTRARCRPSPLRLCVTMKNYTHTHTLQASLPGMKTDITERVYSAEWPNAKKSRREESPLTVANATSGCSTDVGSAISPRRAVGSPSRTSRASSPDSWTTPRPTAGWTPCSASASSPLAPAATHNSAWSFKTAAIALLAT